MSNPLCCCEYVDIDGERNHILTCCCNCVHVDLCFDRLITCRKIPPGTWSKIMSTVNDRLRIPWKGGAKSISFDSFLPIIILPVALYSAAQGVWTSIVTFTFLPLFLMYAHFIYTRLHSTTYFFFVWTLTTLVFIFSLFEYVVYVNLLEIRNDENWVFTLLTLTVLYFVFKVKQVGRKSCIGIAPVEKALGEINLLCSMCNVKVPPRTFHCYICQTCILLRDQHCAWLNCCIGRTNHRWYMLLLMASILLMILFSNLILTTACHPFKFWAIIMLPDDCSDVYFDTLYAFCFVTAIYCLVTAIFLLSLLVHEVYLISLGMTGHEWRNRGSRLRCLGVCGPRPYSKGVFKNWIRYCQGIDLPILPHSI